MRPPAAVTPREDKTALGVAMMALAVVFFTAIDTSAKWLIIAGLAPLQAAFARYAGHFVFSVLLFVPSGGIATFRSARPGAQFLRSAFLMASTVLNFTALKFLPITVTTTIMFAGPIVITLLAIPLLGEKVGIRRIAAVCTGFGGVLVVMQPWGAEFHPAMLLSLAALCSAALYFVMTRLLAGVESNATSQLWSSGLATLCLLPFVLPLWVWPTNALDMAVMLGIGILGAVAHIFVTYAHRLADASILAPVIYIQLLMVAVVGIFIFATWPTVWTLAGGGIIIASGLYIWHRERRKGVRPSAPRADEPPA